MSAIVVRRMHASDLPGVLELDRLAPNEPGRPLTAAEILKLRDCGIHVAVALASGRVAGWLVAEAERSAVRLHGLAVHPRCRRRGAASALVVYVTQRLLTHRRWMVTADVPEASLELQLLFRSLGFRAVGALRGRGEYRMQLVADAAREAV